MKLHSQLITGWGFVTKTNPFPVTHHGLIHWHKDLDNSSFKAQYSAFFRGSDRFEYFHLKKVKDTLSSHPPLSISATISILFSHFSSPCVISVLRLAQRPGCWSRPPRERRFFTFSLLWKRKKIMSLKLTGLATSVWVFPLQLQACLDSRITDQLISHAFLSLP